MNLKAMVSTMIAMHRDWQLEPFCSYIWREVINQYQPMPDLPKEMIPMIQEIGECTAYATVLFLEAGGALHINETESHAIAPVQPLQNPSPADNATAADGPSSFTFQIPVTPPEGVTPEQFAAQVQANPYALFDAVTLDPQGEPEDDEGDEPDQWSDADADDLNAERRALHYGDESPPSLEDLRYEAAERRFTSMHESRPGSWADDDVEDDDPPDGD